MKHFLLALVLLLAFGSEGVSQVKLSGTFVANKSCPAVQSIKKGTNPGNIAIGPGKTYVLLGKNKQAASHYWIEVPGAAPLQRWVGTECGTADAGVVSAPSESSVAVTDNKPFYVLALSWEPAFCEGMADKVECSNQTAQSFEASRFSLHGLWPQPRRKVFCNVDKALIAADDAHHWEALPEPTLSAATKAALDQVMPGTQSLLDRHEWIKHGSCYPGGVAETYFNDAIRLAAAVNAPAVQRLVASNIGKTIQGEDLRAAFDAAFGAGAGDRVRIACKPDGNRQLITELTIGLKGDISTGTPLAALMAGSNPTDPGCPAGIIDPAGLQ